MKFAKTLAAAALLAGATGAQANPLSNISDVLAVYDSVHGQTYDLNLDGLLGLNATSMLTSGNLSIDLSKDATWTAFAGANGANLAGGALFAVAAGGGATNTNFQITSTSATSPYVVTSSTQFRGIGTNITLGEQRINLSLTSNVSNTFADNSAVVADANASSGGWSATAGGSATWDNIFNSQANAQAGIAYGSTGNYFNGVLDSTGRHYNIIGTWNLTGNMLTYTSAAAPAAVPLPAAVWMFGAGLMGFLGLTRRKSAAV